MGHAYAQGRIMAGAWRPVALTPWLVGGELGRAKALVQWWLDTNWWCSTGGGVGGQSLQTLLPSRLLDIYGMSKPVLCSMLEVSKFYDR